MGLLHTLVTGWSGSLCGVPIPSKHFAPTYTFRGGGHCWWCEHIFVGRPGFDVCWLTSGAPGLVLVQGHYIVVDLRGGAIFPHPMEWSIFAATRLSFQVRNGTGRFPCAMPPAKLVVHTLPTHRLLGAAR